MEICKLNTRFKIFVHSEAQSGPPGRLKLNCQQ